MAACRAALLGVIVVASVATAFPVDAFAEPRAVVELFTSQGCSSCPAADQLLGELGEDPAIITMSLPITYWDYLGWKDTLAIPGHSNRQRAYSLVRGDREVYTPQVVVNGAVQVLGSDRAAIEAAIRESRKRSNVLTLPLTMSVGNGEIKVATGESTTVGAGEVWLCTMSHEVPVIIGRGENRGRTITYHNVVRRWIKVGEWTGGVETWRFPLKDAQTDGVDELVAVVQSGTAQSPGSILGAALTTLH
jgi:hypothetical protein